MSEIDDILAEYDYAETISREFANGKFTATLAEANGHRNPDFGLATWMAMQKHEKDNPLLLPEEAKIAVFCTTLLKSWNVTKDGEPVDPKDAEQYLANGRSGRLLFREMHGVCWRPKAFHLGKEEEEDGEKDEGQSGEDNAADDTDNKESKKKRSSASTRKGTSSASRRRTSPRKPKPAAKRSRTASKSTSPA